VGSPFRQALVDGHHHRAGGSAAQATVHLNHSLEKADSADSYLQARTTAHGRRSSERRHHPSTPSHPDLRHDCPAAGFRPDGLVKHGRQRPPRWHPRQVGPQGADAMALAIIRHPPGRLSRRRSLLARRPSRRSWPSSSQPHRLPTPPSSAPTTPPGSPSPRAAFGTLAIACIATAACSGLLRRRPLPGTTHWRCPA
jgi:hypothetical protein